MILNLHLKWLTVNGMKKKSMDKIQLHKLFSFKEELRVSVWDYKP